MKIINNAREELDKKYPKKILCEYCASELEYEKDDIHTGFCGLNYITCPVCGKEVELKDEEDFILTENNIKFPQHFYHFSKDSGSASVFNEENILKAVKDGIEWLRKNKEEFAYMTTSGDMFVVVFNFSGDEDYEIYVSKDFYECTIDYGDKDYN